MSIGTPERFHSLDVLRGLAALAVVLWHWQHFFYGSSGLEPGFQRDQQPLFDVLFLFYRNGGLAVDLFFSLSGFIFFWLYAQPIARCEITARSFFILRFSRLYPLHLITLLVVLVGQAVYASSRHASFVYANNDPYHFLLNLLLIPSIGLEQGNSFNGPVWSVSVEVLLYAVFYLLCRYFRPGPVLLAMLAGIGYAGMAGHLYAPVCRGIGAFYLGAATYRAFLFVRSFAGKRWMTYLISNTTAVLWMLAVWVSYSRFAPNWIPPQRLEIIFFLLPVAVLFPLTILSLALVEADRGGLGKRFSVLGDISYSSYLWHFPLQLFLVILLQPLALVPDLFRSAGALVLFFLLLILVSLVSYRHLEMPMQRKIRKAWLSKRE